MKEEVTQSKEMLAGLLTDGKVSQEEYERLRQALDEKKTEIPPPLRAEWREEEAPQGAKPARRPLRRSRYRSQLLGVCAGLAEYFGIQPWSMRVITFVLFLFTGGWPVVGVYMFIGLVTPQEPLNPSAEDRCVPVDWRSLFDLVVVQVLFIVGIIGFGGFVAPKFVDIYHELGGELPWVTKVALAFCNIIIRYVIILIPVCPAIGGALLGLNLLMPGARSRKWLTLCVRIAMVLFALLFVGALVYPCTIYGARI